MWRTPLNAYGCACHPGAGDSGAWGQVSAQQGGVIIPALDKLPFKSSFAGSTSFGYSDCFKWGYADTVSLHAVPVRAAVASLGLSYEKVGGAGCCQVTPWTNMMNASH